MAGSARRDLGSIIMLCAGVAMAVFGGVLLFQRFKASAPLTISAPVTAAAAAPAATAASATNAAATAEPTLYLFKHPKPAPSLDVTALDGSKIHLKALRGKVVLLNFWATWCGPCREEIPEFERLQREYPSQLQVIGMSVDELPPTTVARIAHQMGINYPVAMASPTLQARFGGMPAIPVTFVIDRTGEVEQTNHGANPYEVFNAEVKAMLGMPVGMKVVRIDQLSPNGKVGTIDIPGIAADLKKLTPAQRQKALAELNATACTCGCEWSLATCRVTDPSCSYSLPEALKVVASIRAGS